MGKLDGKIALITGGTAGIGKAIAVALAQNGAKVAIFGTDLQRGAKALEELNEASRTDDNLFYQVNVADKGEVDEGIKNVVNAFGTVDILINNAGITRDQLLMRMSESDWDDVMDVNVKSCYNTTQALVRLMMKARRGVIINISSVIGLIGNPGQANYAASKAAVIGFTKALAKELAPRGIRVNCIAPGFIKTRMTEELTEEQKKGIMQQIPLSYIGDPEDIANAVLFFVGDESRYVTGQVLTVDGGMVI